jgi:hypothetical protein
MSPLARLRRVLALCALPIASAAACSSTPDQPAQPNLPPRICKVPGALPRPWFHEVTSEVGLAPTPFTCTQPGACTSSNPISNVAVAADLDGDGWVDVISVAGSAERGTDANRARALYMNREVNGKRVFVDETAKSGLFATRDGTGGRGFNLVNLGDLDDDGDVDVVLCPADEISATYSPQDGCDAMLNDGHGHFTLAPTSDLDAKIFWAPSGALLDYDHDGYLDFWPATVAHWPYDPNGPNDMPPTLFRGGGDGTFANVSAQAGLPTHDGTVKAGTQWRHVFGVTACDLNGDGWDDMIFADYGREQNQVWINNGDGTFSEQGNALGLDEDARVDYTDDQSYRCYCKLIQSQGGTCNPAAPAPQVDCCTFCKQQGISCPSNFCPPTFRGWDPTISPTPAALGGNYFSFACADVDDDGDMDLMSATITHGDVGTSSDPSELILNPGDGTPFVRPGNDTDGLARNEYGLYWNYGDSIATFVDLDLDGRKDIFIGTTGAYGNDRAWLWHQKDDGTFEEVAKDVGLIGQNLLPNLSNPAFVDIDGDGDLDVIVGSTAAPRTLRVLRNDVGQAQNWLRVKLVGGGPGAANTSGIGAIVRVTAGGRAQTQELQGGFGHGNVENDLVLTFGLGATCDVDDVAVQWPDATESVVDYGVVAANYTVELDQGDPTVHYPYQDREQPQ